MSSKTTYIYSHYNFIENLITNPKADKSVVFLLQKHRDDYITNLEAALISSNYATITNVIEEYLTFAKRMELTNPKFLGSKSTYYSSILEDLPVYVSKDIIKSIIENNTSPLLSNKEFRIGKTECIIKRGISGDGSDWEEEKDIDFAVAVKSHTNKWICLSGFECKKYMDKTMFSSVQYTFTAFQALRPSTSYNFMVEDEARKKKDILNSIMIGKEFVLTNKSRLPEKNGIRPRNPIDKEALEKFIVYCKDTVEKTVQKYLTSLTIK